MLYINRSTAQSDTFKRQKKPTLRVVLTIAGTIVLLLIRLLKTMASYLDLQIFADLVRHKRGKRGLREVTSETSVSASTLSRIENGKIPDIDTFLAVCDWLEIPPAEFIKNTEDKGKKEDYSAICAKLRADSRIKPEIADAIATLIESVIEI